MSQLNQDPGAEWAELYDDEEEEDEEEVCRHKHRELWELGCVVFSTEGIIYTSLLVSMYIYI